MIQIILSDYLAHLSLNRSATFLFFIFASSWAKYGMLKFVRFAYKFNSLNLFYVIFFVIDSICRKEHL